MSVVHGDTTVTRRVSFKRFKQRFPIKKDFISGSCGYYNSDFYWSTSIPSKTSVSVVAAVVTDTLTSATSQIPMTVTSCYAVASIIHAVLNVKNAVQDMCKKHGVPRLTLFHLFANVIMNKKTLSGFAWLFLNICILTLYLILGNLN